jgi:N-methylhydantoinase A
MGLLLTDLRADFAATRLARLDATAIPVIAEAFRDLSSRAQHWFTGEAIPPEARRVTRSVDMRYAGQNYELAIPLPEGEITQASLDALAAGFAETHQRLYGFLAEEEPIQLVTYRLEAAGLVPKAQFQPHKDTGPDATAAITGTRNLWLPETATQTPCPVYDRDKLTAGNRIQGPAIIEQMDATTLVLPGMVARVEPYLNLVLEPA